MRWIPALILGIGLALASASAWGATAVPDIRFERLQQCAAGSESSELRCRPVRLHHVDPQGRRIWLLADVVVERQASGTAPLGLELRALASSRLFWDGQLLAENGAPASRPVDERPGRYHFMAPLPGDLLAPGRHRLAIEMSSHGLSEKVETPVHQLSVAPWADPRDVRLRASASVLVLAGALLLAAVYFISIYAFERASSSALLLAATATFAVAQLAAEISSAFLNYAYPVHILRVQAILAFAFAFSVSVVAYAARRFAPGRTLWWVAAVLAADLIVIVAFPSYDARTFLCLALGCAGALAASLRGAARRVPGSLAAAIAFLAFLIPAFLDVTAFLDRTFYIGLVAMFCLLFAEQARDHGRARSLREEARLANQRLELELLRRQLSPHYVMNSLNALLEWVESAPSVAARMIVALGDEYRRLARVSRKRMIPLAEELELCRSHLALMSLQKDAAYSLDETILNPDRPIPPGILHALLENAVTHGGHQRGVVFRLRERTMDDGEGAVLELESPAPDQARRHAGSGTGEAYVRARLREAFADRAVLETGPADHGGWLARIILR